MKINKKIMVLAAVLGSASTANASDKEAFEAGKALFETNCMACHKLTAKSHDGMIAPFIFAIQNHYAVHKEKDEFVGAIAEWISNPQEERTLMPGAIRKFGLMPPMPLSEEDRMAIATFMYHFDAEAPDWYAEHYRQDHGKDPDMAGHKKKKHNNN